MLAAQFTGGEYVTIYLSPRDYHRVHTPVSATLSAYDYIPGQLWPVKLQGPGQPVRDGSRASVKLVRKLSSEDFGKRACPMTKKGAISPR